MSLIIKFSQNIFKNKTKKKKNFIIYHFLVKRKTHERIDLLITGSVNIYQIKKCIPIVIKTCFSEGKLIKQFGNPSFSTRTPLSLSNFHDPPLCLNFKNKKPPPNFRGKETMLTQKML